MVLFQWRSIVSISNTLNCKHTAYELISTDLFSFNCFYSSQLSVFSATLCKPRATNYYYGLSAHVDLLICRFVFGQLNMNC